MRLNPSQKTLIFATFLLILFLCFIPQRDLDMFIYLKNGELTFQKGEIINKDYFSYGDTKDTYVNNQWLSEIILYYLNSLFGYWGLIFYKTIIGFIIAIFLFLLMKERTNNLLLSGFLTLFSLCLILRFLNSRPQILTFCLLAILLYLFYIYQTKRKRYILFLPLIIVFWSSLHGGHLVGLFTFVLFVCCQVMKIIVKLPFSLGAEKIDKKGIKFLIFLFLITLLFFSFPLFISSKKLGSQPMEEKKVEKSLMGQLSEWQSFKPLNPYNYIYDFYLVLGILLILINFKRLNLTDLSFYFVFTLSPFYAQRFLPLWVIVSMPIIATCINSLKDSPYLSRRWWPSTSYLYIFLVFILIAYLFTFPFRWIFAFSVLDKDEFERKLFPKKAVEFIRLNNLPGRMFNDVGWGAYLIWQLHPDYYVGIDGRFSAIYKFDYINHYLRTLRGEPGWEEFLNRWEVNFIIIPKFHPLAFRLWQDTDWQLIYENKKTVIFIKNIKRNWEIIKKAKEYKLKYP